MLEIQGTLVTLMLLKSENCCYLQGYIPFPPESEQKIDLEVQVLGQQEMEIRRYSKEVIVRRILDLDEGI